MEECDMDLYWAYQERDKALARVQNYKQLTIILIIIFAVVAVVVILVLLIKLKPSKGILTGINFEGATKSGSASGNPADH